MIRAGRRYVIPVRRIPSESEPIVVPARKLPPTPPLTVNEAGSRRPAETTLGAAGAGRP
jgi:hypothetical protein